MYFKVLYLLNDIRALIFHPIEHQDVESVPVFVCKCIIIPDLDLSELDSIPHGLYNYIIIILALEASFPSSNIASKVNTQ